IIGAMHAAGRAAIARARAVLGSFAGAMIVVWFRDGRPAWIPALTAFPGRLFGVPAEALTWGVSWSPILLGTGPLVGPRLGLSILFGACVAWGLIAPLLVRHGLVAAASYSSLREWLLWPGVALMLSGALVQLALQARTFGRTLADLRRLRAGPTSAGGRSEEHTSELQSLTNLVCRLLLEKKKTQPTHTHCLRPLISYLFNDPATTDIYTLSLHDALPISATARCASGSCGPGSRSCSRARWSSWRCRRAHSGARWPIYAGCGRAQRARAGRRARDARARGAPARASAWPPPRGGGVTAPRGTS